MKKVVLLLFVSCLFLTGCDKLEFLNPTKKEEANNVVETPSTTEPTTTTPSTTTPSTTTPTTPTTTKQELICTKETQSTLNFVTEMTYYYENGKTVKLGVRYVYDVSQYNDAQKQSIAATKMCETSAITDDLGMKDCTEALYGSSYIVSGSADKLLDQAIYSLEETKSSLVLAGWTCNVK